MNDEIKPIAECKTLQELFADPARWTQLANSKNSEGQTCYVHSPQAHCFCLAGGTMRVYPLVEDRFRVFNLLTREITRDSSGVVGWNDDPRRTVEDVQALVKKLNI